MKAIIVASVMAIMLLLLQTLLLRYHSTEHRARGLNILFLSLCAILSLAWWMTPDDLGFLPSQFLTEPRWLDFGATLFFFSAAFFGGALQLYNLSDRGLSLRILIDIVEDPGARWSAPRVVRHYSHGRGLQWMYKKRIRDLVAHDLISVKDDRFILTTRGRAVGKTFLTLRRIFNLQR